MTLDYAKERAPELAKPFAKVTLTRAQAYTLTLLNPIHLVPIHLAMHPAGGQDTRQPVQGQEQVEGLQGEARGEACRGARAPSASQAQTTDDRTAEATG